MKDHRQQPLAAANREPHGQFALGMSLGTCIGVSLGVALDNLGLWLPLGIALGLAMGSFTRPDWFPRKKAGQAGGPLIKSHPDRQDPKS